ncbi:MAG: endonuclease/exonuclease/phosphatase family protein [Pseudomonadota bacterium]
MFRPALIFCLLMSTGFFGSASAQTKIAVWNMEAELSESLEDRIQDFSEFASQIQPDIVVLVEVNGEEGTKAFADQLGWSEKFFVTSDLSELSTTVFFALEMAVISKFPIEKAIEYDASVDGAHVIRDHTGATQMVEELELKSDGIPHFGQPLKSTDRGTIRVDLANGLSIFPIHLKSNRVGECSTPREALKTIRDNGFALSSALEEQLEQAGSIGFPTATQEHLTNAAKRERVMAAIVREAEKAIDEGRVVVFAGDFNTAFEPGKKGSDPSDCTLQDFSCAKAPFPADACTSGDGFDDTLGILDSALVGPTTWTVLSDTLGRTYDDEAFADKAIDHIVVAEQHASDFAIAEKADSTFGSDHFPVITHFGN